MREAIRARSRGLFFLALVAVTVIAYWPVLGNTLVCDDYYLLGLDRIHLFSEGNPVLLGDFDWVTSAMSPYFFRPVVLSVWLALSHFFNSSPWPFHTLNVLLHAANAWLVFRLLMKLKATMKTAVLAAMLFAVTPIGPEAVTWASGSFDLFSLFFLLLGMGFYASFLKTGKRLDYAATLLATMAAFFSKESAMIIVIIIPAMELLFGNQLISADDRREVAGRSFLRRAAVRVLPFLGCYAMFTIVRYIALGSFLQGYQLPSADTVTIHGPLESLSVLASPLSSDFFPAWVITAVGVYTFLLLVLSVSLVVLGWRTSSVVTRRLWVFFAISFPASLLPVSALLVGGLNRNLAHSRFLYMPTAFLLALIAVGLLEFGQARAIIEKLGVLAMAALVPLFFWGLHENNYYWQEAASSEGHILGEIIRLLPDPPEGSVIYLRISEATETSRIYWCTPMLQPAVRSHYRRYDLKVIQGGVGDEPSDNSYLFDYNGKSGLLKLVHGPPV